MSPSPGDRELLNLHGTAPEQQASQPAVSASSWSGYPATARTCHLGECTADQQHLGERGKEEREESGGEEKRREEQLFLAQFVPHSQKFRMNGPFRYWSG